MMVSGLKVLNMVVECGKPQKAINMWDNGTMD
jgi:hypothetical protein